MKSAGLPHWPAPGNTLALAAPAAAFDHGRLEAGCAVLAGLAPHLTLRRDQDIFARQGYLAGGDQERARHLGRLMADPEVGAVLCVRGGFGSSRLLPLLDLPALAASRRLLVGFSDLTCLLNPLALRGLITVHGPVVTQLPDLDAESLEDLAALLAGDPAWPATLAGEPRGGGQVEGPLLGGNLTMLCHLMGTPYLPLEPGFILMIEDAAEVPYRLDRLLTQLELAGVLEMAAGVALGGLTRDDRQEQDRENVLADRLAALGKPVVCRLPFGHGPRNRCLPLGARARLDADQGLLSVGVDLG